MTLLVHWQIINDIGLIIPLSNVLMTKIILSFSIREIDIGIIKLLSGSPVT